MDYPSAASTAQPPLNTILEEYIFAPEANFVEGDGKQPEMLTSFFARRLHPLIHAGRGVEFYLPGTCAEVTVIFRISHLFITPLSFYVQILHRLLCILRNPNLR